MNQKTKRRVSIAVMVTVFALIIAGFTFEPLISFISNSKELPPNTLQVIRIPESASSNLAMKEAIAITSALGSPLSVDDATTNRLSSLLFPVLKGTKTVAISQGNSGKYPFSFEVSARGNIETAKDAIRKIAAYITPVERNLNLPDKTRAVEIVAEPGKVNVAQAASEWSVLGLPTPLSLRSFKEKLQISTNSPAWAQSGFTYIPTSCRTNTAGETIISILPLNKANFIDGVITYLKNFDCFQSYSVFVR